MSYTGITINDIDLLEKWGLILLDDLKIEEAKQKTIWVDIPGTDGAVDMSTALTDGEPVFGMRSITMTLYASGYHWDGANYIWTPAPTETQVNLIRSELQGLYHGRHVKLWLPDDQSHYFEGVASIGDKEGYNSGTIPISFTVGPYRLKNSATEVLLTIPASGNTEVLITNEQRSVVPELTVSASTTIKLGSHSWALEAGTKRIPALKLPAGETTLEVIGTSGETVLFKYQEARL